MLIDGKLLSEKILHDLTKRVSKLEEDAHIQPHLGIIIVGTDAASASYVRQKKRMGEQIGGLVSVYEYPQNISDDELKKSIDFLQKDGNLHGLIIQLPLPPAINTEEIINRVDLDKDVDGFRKDSDFHEPIAIAVIRILEEIYKIEQVKKRTVSQFITWLKAQKIVVIGKGKTGGKPIISLLKEMGITAEVIDSKTQNRTAIIQTADILICAVGNKGTIVTEDMIKKDVIILGIGMHIGPDGKLHGDYEIEEIKYKAAYYTPIPGGVGPVNAAMLLVNVVEAAEKKT